MRHLGRGAVVFAAAVVVGLGCGERGKEPAVGEVSMTCPEGAKWNGNECVRTSVVTEVQCPAGTKWDGKQCAASVSTSCASGLHFEPGRGCVPDQSAAVTPPSGGSPPARVEGGMVSIPAGDFMMGAEDGDANEKPVHRVHVNGFSMDVTEVTVSAYQACVNAGACPPAATDFGYCNYGKSDKSDHPINCVSWDNASAYCGWAGKRLPTEEEWEYAARGSEGRKYPWGSDAPGSQLCWNRLSSKQGTCTVGSYPAGVFGLRDMAGNVWEWTASLYSDDYSKSRAGTAHVDRGGSWIGENPAHVRGAIRNWLAPSARFSNVGFRCAR